MHPRTRRMVADFGLTDKYARNGKSPYLCDLPGSLEFNYLVKNAKGIITDFGGITKEASVIGIPY